MIVWCLIIKRHFLKYNYSYFLNREMGLEKSCCNVFSQVKRVTRLILQFYFKNDKKYKSCGTILSEQNFFGSKFLNRYDLRKNGNIYCLISVNFSFWYLNLSQLSAFLNP